MVKDNPSIEVAFDCDETKKMFLDWYCSSGWVSLRGYLESQDPWRTLDSYPTGSGLYVEAVE